MGNLPKEWKTRGRGRFVHEGAKDGYGASNSTGTSNPNSISGTVLIIFPLS
jgi:hypothetical protein